MSLTTRVVFVLLVLFPLSVSAAWWNPLSWLEKAPAPIVQETAAQAPGRFLDTVIIPGRATSTDVVQNSCPPAVQPKAVVRTVTQTVADPSQAARIEDLENQVTTLKEQIHTDLEAHTAFVKDATAQIVDIGNLCVDTINKVKAAYNPTTYIVPNYISAPSLDTAKAEYCASLGEYGYDPACGGPMRQ